MQRTSTWILLSAFAAASLAAQTPDVKLDNELVRVLEITIQPHQPSPLRQHPMNRVLIYRDAGQMTRTIAGKVEKSSFKAGDVQWDPAGPPYVGENITDHPIEVVQIELKNKAKGPPLVTKLDPPTADAEHYKVDFENDQVRVLRIHYGAHSKGGLHEHVRDRVVVNLGAEARAKYGDVRMAGAATHAEENATDQAADRLAVEVK